MESVTSMESCTTGAPCWTAEECWGLGKQILHDTVQTQPLNHAGVSASSLQLRVLCECQLEEEVGELPELGREIKLSTV